MNKKNTEISPFTSISKYRIPYLSLCENPNYMMTLENTGSQCRWNVGQHGLHW
jgi:hypothetical protein